MLAGGGDGVPGWEKKCHMHAKCSIFQRKFLRWIEANLYVVLFSRYCWILYHHMFLFGCRLALLRRRIVPIAARRLQGTSLPDNLCGHPRRDFAPSE